MYAAGSSELFHAVPFSLSARSGFDTYLCACHPRPVNVPFSLSDLQHSTTRYPSTSEELRRENSRHEEPQFFATNSIPYFYFARFIQCPRT